MLGCRKRIPIQSYDIISSSLSCGVSDYLFCNILFEIILDTCHGSGDFTFKQLAISFLNHVECLLLTFFVVIEVSFGRLIWSRPVNIFCLWRLGVILGFQRPCFVQAMFCVKSQRFWDLAVFLKRPLVTVCAKLGPGVSLLPIISKPARFSCLSLLIVHWSLPGPRIFLV